MRIIPFNPPNPIEAQYEEELEFWRCIALFEELKFPCAIMFYKEYGSMIGFMMVEINGHDNEN